MLIQTEPPPYEAFKLDAFGHLSWGVGYNDECDPDPLPAMAIIAKVAEGDLDEEDVEALSLYPRECGDWTAWVDVDRIGDWVGYHVVVDSDAGGLTDTVESGVLNLKEARRELPWLLDGYRDTASEYLSESGTWFTPEEIAEDLKTIQRWKDHLKELLK